MNFQPPRLTDHIHEKPTKWTKIQLTLYAVSLALAILPVFSERFWFRNAYTALEVLEGYWGWLHFPSALSPATLREMSYVESSTNYHRFEITYTPILRVVVNAAAIRE